MRNCGRRRRSALRPQGPGAAGRWFRGERTGHGPRLHERRRHLGGRPARGGVYLGQGAGTGVQGGRSRTCHPPIYRIFRPRATDVLPPRRGRQGNIAGRRGEEARGPEQERHLDCGKQHRARNHGDVVGGCTRGPRTKTSYAAHVKIKGVYTSKKTPQYSGVLRYTIAEYEGVNRLFHI
jgi:hypothetical protein